MPRLERMQRPKTKCDQRRGDEKPKIQTSAGDQLGERVARRRLPIGLEMQGKNTGEMSII